MSADDIKRERKAVRRLEKALDTIASDLGWYWHWDDGQGGFVLENLASRVRAAGYRWPLDVEQATKTYKKDVISRTLSRQVMERDHYRCVQCGTHLNLTCDHIIPESKGGPTTFDNLQTLCRSCNSSKGARWTEVEG